MKKITFTISGMHCTSCAMSIDGDLEDTKGVKKASTNYAKQKTEVEYDPNVVNEDQMKKIITELGYTAQIVQ